MRGEEDNVTPIDTQPAAESRRQATQGKLHHTMMGTAAVAIGTAAAIPGTLVNLAAGGGARDSVTFGHPSGTLKVRPCPDRPGGCCAITPPAADQPAGCCN